MEPKDGNIFVTYFNKKEQIRQKYTTTVHTDHIEVKEI